MRSLHTVNEERIDNVKTVQMSGLSISYNQSGQMLSEHWYVPPGRHVYRFQPGKNVFDIPFDTTVHYISPHLHPYAEWIEFKDLTTNQIIFHSQAENYSDRPILKRSEHFSSEKGIPVYKDHEYEVICGYDNTTSSDVDAMCSVYLYFRDKDFSTLGKGFSSDKKSN